MSRLLNVQLDVPATGAVGWGSDVQAILDALDVGVSGHYVVLTADSDVAAYDAVRFVGGDAGESSPHVERADLASLSEAHGIALNAGAAGDPVAVLRRGVLSAAADVLPWSGAAMETEFFLSDDGALVEEATGCVADDGDTLFRQRVAVCLTEGDYERFLIDPERDCRLGGAAVVSSRFLQVSGAAATESFANVSGTRWEPTVLVNDNATKVFSYSFVLPESFRSFSGLQSLWALRVGYLVTGSCTVQMTAHHDGAGTKTVVAPASGSSTSWANYDVPATAIAAGSPAAGKPFHCEVTVTGTGTCRLATVARLRCFPKPGFGPYAP